MSIIRKRLLKSLGIDGRSSNTSSSSSSSSTATITTDNGNSQTLEPYIGPRPFKRDIQRSSTFLWKGY